MKNCPIWNLGQHPSMNHLQWCLLHNYNTLSMQLKNSCREYLHLVDYIKKGMNRIRYMQIRLSPTNHSYLNLCTHSNHLHRHNTNLLQQSHHHHSPNHMSKGHLYNPNNNHIPNYLFIQPNLNLCREVPDSRYYFLLHHNSNTYDLVWNHHHR